LGWRRIPVAKVDYLRGCGGEEEQERRDCENFMVELVEEVECERARR